jgi:hypothetical protein
MFHTFRRMTPSSMLAAPTGASGAGWDLTGDGPVMPIVLDTPWAGAIDAVGGLSLTLYERLSRWKREVAVRHPEESTAFQLVARKRRS